MEITDNVPSSDYVFTDDYELRSIGEVESYIRQHKHLPDVPSAEEFKKHGYKAGEMDDLLLKKIEELSFISLSRRRKLRRLNKNSMIM